MDGPNGDYVPSIDAETTIVTGDPGLGGAAVAGAPDTGGRDGVAGDVVEAG
jgi:hypothetical protein